ncbi:hypothetical protein EOL96_03915 [Candidatus Saccharibacteria bacterium]|nr:hypothetical protein [Candidatus Saccharibacteria bacterium]
MEKISSLIKKLADDSHNYPHLANLTFLKGSYFAWNHTNITITYDASDMQSPVLLLHEYGHAILNHQSYATDIRLLSMERDAWDIAIKNGKLFGVNIKLTQIEDALDTYRDWMHARSLCPKCDATGLQSAPNQFTCVACQNTWKVNDARHCALRRYDTTQKIAP